MPRKKATPIEAEKVETPTPAEAPVETPKVEPTVPVVDSAEKAKFRAFLKQYATQHPVKYQQKKAKLLEQLDKIP